MADPDDQPTRREPVSTGGRHRPATCPMCGWNDPAGTPDAARRIERVPPGTTTYRNGFRWDCSSCGSVYRGSEAEWMRNVQTRVAAQARRHREAELASA